MTDRELFQKAFEALEDMMEEFRCYDLPYGSKAYSSAKEARLDLYARLSKEEQKPVAYMYEFYADMGHKGLAFEEQPSAYNIPLYASPPKLIPLTDEQLELINECGDTDSYKFALAIEAAHGIGEKK